ncbi:MAG: transcription antitermination protein NusB, partial [Lachnospiraceae bacterium]|nr:transcription antitermination protein NusB [Lachnospiraceae bacterium]
MIGRSAVREHVFILLFESLFNSREEMEAQSVNYFEGLEKPVDEESEAYISDRFHSVEVKLDEIDSMIEEKSTGWKVGRIGKVELSILRLAVYEIVYDDEVPVGVAINE